MLARRETSNGDDQLGLMVSLSQQPGKISRLNEAAGLNRGSFSGWSITRNEHISNGGLSMSIQNRLSGTAAPTWTYIDRPHPSTWLEPLR